MGNMFAAAIRRILAPAALVAVSVALTLAVAEIGLRFAYPSGYLIWKPHLSRTFLPAPGVMPGVSGESKLQISSRGLRADELTNDHAYRILTIGGSTTECLFLDQSETWPQLLQTTLNRDAAAPRTWVGNAGMSGRNSRHHVMAMRHLPLQEMKVDTVLVLAGVNDLSIRLSQGDAFDPAALRKPDVQGTLIEETFTGMPYGNPRDPWLKRTLLWQLLRKLKTRFTGSGEPAQVQDQVGSVYQVWRKHRREAREIRTTLPDLSSALQEYAGNLREMAALARAKSIRLILLTQPSMWRPGLSKELESLLWFGGVGDFQAHAGQPYYSVEALARGMAMYNDTVLDVCRTEGLECIDLSTLDKGVTNFYDDVHFNEEGAHRVATNVAKHLQTRAPYSRAPSTSTP